MENTVHYSLFNMINLVSILFALLVQWLSLNGQSLFSFDDGLLSISLQTRQMEYQYVYEAYKRNYNASERCVSHDPDFHPLSYQVKQNMKWSHRSVCSNDTFLLLMFFTYHQDVERRNLIRRYIKQGMVVNGKVINYVQIIAGNDTDLLSQYEQENSEYNDLLISLHKDIREYWTITVLDAYMWVRDYCRQAHFVSKVDGDVWVHLGNLVQHLRTVTTCLYYGGHTVNGILHSGRYYKRVKSSPSDCPEHRVSFNLGGANIMSQAVVPYVSIGTRYLDYVLPAAEDVLMGFMLRKAGINATSIRGFTPFVFYERLSSGVIPKDVIYVHVRGMNTIRELYHNYSFVSLQPYRK